MRGYKVAEILDDSSDADARPVKGKTKKQRVAQVIAVQDGYKSSSDYSSTHTVKEHIVENSPSFPDTVASTPNTPTMAVNELATTAVRDSDVPHANRRRRIRSSTIASDPLQAAMLFKGPVELPAGSGSTGTNGSPKAPKNSLVSVLPSHNESKTTACESISTDLPLVESGSEKATGEAFLTEGTDVDGVGCGSGLGGQEGRSSMGWQELALSDVQDKLTSLVQSPVFDYGSGALVILNAVTIGVQTDYMARYNCESTPPFFRFVEFVFCMVFSAEILLRIGVYKLKFFWMSGWRWNLFDALLVALQLMEEGLTLIVGASAGFNFSFMRILRILRLVRIIRIVRVLRLITELRTIISSIAGSMKSLAWTVVLLFLMIYVVGVYLTQLVLDHRITLTGVLTEEEIALSTYYGSLILSILSLFQSISGGIDWKDLTSPLINQISPLTGFVFSLYIAFAVLALLNVVTGVFVESAMKAAKEDHERNMISQVKRLFSSADIHNHGTVSWAEFANQLGNEDMQEFFKIIDVDISEARGVFHLLDVDDSGTIDLMEFLNGCLGLHGPAKAIDLSTLMYELRLFRRTFAEHAAAVNDNFKHVAEALSIDHSDSSEGESGIDEALKLKRWSGSKPPSDCTDQGAVQMHQMRRSACHTAR